jgi:hypothetical protein
MSARRLAGSSEIGHEPRPLIKAAGRRHRLRHAALEQFDLDFLTGLWASTVFGRVIVGFPIEKSALSRSTMRGCPRADVRCCSY